MLVLDTNVCIALLRRRAWALEALSSTPPKEVAVSAVTVGELYHGALRSEHPRVEAEKVEAFLGPIEILPFGRDEARQWGVIEAELRKTGTAIEAEDGMIAATAKVRGAVVVTGNLRHFQRVKGLKVVDWEQSPPRKPRR